MGVGEVSMARREVVVATMVAGMATEDTVDTGRPAAAAGAVVSALAVIILGQPRSGSRAASITAAAAAAAATYRHHKCIVPCIAYCPHAGSSIHHMPTFAIPHTDMLHSGMRRAGAAVVVAMLLTDTTAW